MGQKNNPDGRSGSRTSTSEQAVRRGTSSAHMAEEARPNWWIRFEARYLLNVATSLSLAATAIMLVEAFSRGFLSHSYFWAEESVRYLMIWAFFLALGAAGHAGHHIRTDLLVSLLPSSVQRFTYLVASLAGLTFATILFIASIPQVYRYYTMGMMTESTLDLPLWILSLAMPIGALLFACYYLGCLLRSSRGVDPFVPQPGTTGAGN